MHIFELPLNHRRDHTYTSSISNEVHTSELPTPGPYLQMHTSELPTPSNEVHTSELPSPRPRELSMSSILLSYLYSKPANRW